VIPLRDANPTRRLPVITPALIAACFAVFAYELTILAGSGEDGLNQFFFEYGVVPRDVTHAIATGRFLAPAIATIFTSMFLHGGWLHILGNMLYLWIFGNNVEDRLGRVPFLLFYLVGGAAAALTQVAINPESREPLVGASGAIAAALGAYLVLYPGARILSLVFLGFWFVLQLIDGLGSLGGSNAQGGVAFFAHIGGFAFGVVIGLLIRGRGAGRRLVTVG
jgi:membrane associated rhomboid family serine protease